MASLSQCRGPRSVRQAPWTGTPGGTDGDGAPEEVTAGLTDERACEPSEYYCAGNGPKLQAFQGKRELRCGLGWAPWEQVPGQGRV